MNHVVDFDQLAKFWPSGQNSYTLVLANWPNPLSNWPQLATENCSYGQKTRAWCLCWKEATCRVYCE
jgi:hypothetical protein